MSVRRCLPQAVLDPPREQDCKEVHDECGSLEEDDECLVVAEKHKA